MPRTRREVFTGVGMLLSVALAGCQSNDGRRSQTPAESTRARTTPVSPDPGWVKLNLVPTQLRAIVKRAVRNRSSFSAEERTTLDRLASNGSVTVHNITRHSELPLHPPYLVELNGSVHLIDKRTIATRESEVRRFHIEVLNEPRENALAFGDLSELDQTIVKRGLTEEYLENGTPFSGTFFYTFERRSPAESRIATAEGDVFVAYQDDTLKLRSMGSDTVVEQDVRYDLTEVAPTRSATQEYIDRKYIRTLSPEEIPQPQREILTAAIENQEGYREDGQGSQSFRALLDRLQDVPQVPNGGRYVRYDGTVYQVVQTGVEV